MNKQLRDDSITRAKRRQEQGQDRKRQRDKSAPVPASESKPAQEQKTELRQEVLDYLVFPEDSASQIGEANLKEEDVVIYLRAVVFSPKTFKNVTQRGPTGLKDYAATQPAYVLVVNREDAPDVLKGLLMANLNPPKLQEE